MARLRNNTFMISGTFGDMVFCNGPEKGAYVRRRPVKKELSPAQLQNTLKLQLAMQFLQPLRDLIKIAWFRTPKSRSMPFDAARSYFIRNSLNTISGNVEVSYKDVLLSNGSLGNVDNLRAELQENVLQITWDYTIKRHILDYSSLVLVVYNEKQKSSLHFTGIARRKDLILQQELPDSMLNGTLHIYLFFISPDCKDSSGTSYLKIENG